MVLGTTLGSFPLPSPPRLLSPFTPLCPPCSPPPGPGHPPPELALRHGDRRVGAPQVRGRWLGHTAGRTAAARAGFAPQSSASLALPPVRLTRGLCLLLQCVDQQADHSKGPCQRPAEHRPPERGGPVHRPVHNLCPGRQGPLTGACVFVRVCGAGRAGGEERGQAGSAGVGQRGSRGRERSAAGQLERSRAGSSSSLQ